MFGIGRVRRAAVVAVLGGVCGVAFGQDAARARVDEVLKGMGHGHRIGQVAVSPDGKRLAWSERGRIVVAPLDDLKKGEKVATPKDDGACEEADYAWSPDSKGLAFFSDCGAAKEGQRDLYVWAGGGAARKVTALDGYTDMPEFSPDGKEIAFLYVAGATRPAGALAAMKPWAGVMGEDGVEIQRVALVRADGADQKPEQVTPETLHVFEFDWRPDGKALAYVAANPPGENNWWVAKLYVQLLSLRQENSVVPSPPISAKNAEMDGARRQYSIAESIAGPAIPVLDPATVKGSLHGLQIAVPRWRPDGKSIAFIGGLMSDQGSTGGDVWMVSAEGGAPQDLTPGRPTTPQWIEWGSNDYLFENELAGGNQQLIRFKVTGDAGKATATFGAPIFSIPGSVGDGRLEGSLSSTADHSLFVFSASTFERAPEIYGAKPGTVMSSGLDGVMPLSSFNDGVKPGWGKAESVSWRSEKFRVQGWLLYPKDYAPKKKYPLLVAVHGGPAAAVTSRWGGGGGLSATAFSALGYFVLLPNPRGSFGQGEEFVQANRKDFGYGDLRDILAGLDAIEAKYPVDAQRVGLMGWSYGGFMTMFDVTQTGRFKAAVAGAGIANWQSYYGENSIGEWMIPYFGASVYDDPAVYAKSSAINFIKQVKTPVLVVVGDRDGECPAPQSFEFWHALKAEGVPTQLVVYPNEGHGFVDAEHRKDVLARAVEWFEKYMPAE